MSKPLSQIGRLLAARAGVDFGLCRAAARWLVLCFVALPVYAAETALLTNSLGEPADELSYAVSVDGTRIATGSPGENVSSGAAYIFDCAIAPCLQPIRIAPVDLVAGNLFGAAVSQSGDTLAISAPGQVPGAVYVFVRQGNAWIQQARLVASNASAGDRFGRSVSLDGEYLAIAADQGSAQAGTVYVFARNGSMWSQQTQLTAQDGTPGSRFGASISLDATSLLIGAPLKAVGPAGSFANGAAYVFVRSGEIWSQQAVLPSLTGSNAALFGMAVSLAGDRALIGAPLDANGAGSAFVVQRTGVDWSPPVQITRALPVAGDRFGWSVALVDDIALVGAPYAQFACGKAHLFRFDNGVWSEHPGASPATAIPASLAGWSVSADSERWAIGAPGYAGGADHSGAAYWFDTTVTLFRDGFDDSGANACVDPEG